MFANLTSFLFGRQKSSQPMRRVRLGMETLETRAVPACAFQQWHYDGLEGTNYDEVKCGTYVIQTNTDLTKDDYNVYGGGFRNSDVHLEQKGRQLIIKDNLTSVMEGPIEHFYSIVRKRDNKLMLSSQVKFDAGNAPLNCVSAQEFYASSSHEPPRQLLATFFDSHGFNTVEPSYEALIHWGDGSSSEGECVVSGNAVQVYGRHTYTHNNPLITLYTISVVVGETGGMYNLGSKFCTRTHNVSDPDGNGVAVGGMATATTYAWVTPKPWADDLFGAQAIEVEQAVRTAWVSFTADAKDSAKDLFKSLGGDAAANQKLLVNTTAAVLRRLPTANSAVWDSIMQEAIHRSPSQPGRTLNQVAFDIALGKLVTMLQTNLSNVTVDVAGITGLEAKLGVAGLTEAARKLAEPAAKSISDRTLLNRYLRIHRPQINPGKPIDDNATLTAANMDLVLKATTGAALAADQAGIANWQTLEALTSQRLGRTVTFGAEQTGKDLTAALAALADGSTGTLHSAATTLKPNGALLSFAKLNGQVFVIDARLGTFAILNATTMYQMLNTTK